MERNGFSPADYINTNALRIYRILFRKPFYIARSSGCSTDTRLKAVFIGFRDVPIYPLLYLDRRRNYVTAGTHSSRNPSPVTTIGFCFHCRRGKSDVRWWPVREFTACRRVRVIDAINESKRRRATMIRTQFTRCATLSAATRTYSKR